MVNQIVDVLFLLIGHREIRLFHQLLNHRLRDRRVGYGRHFVQRELQLTVGFEQGDPIEIVGFVLHGA
ncbi:hypothetical protein D3C81_1029110 [compost metagenome]